MKVSSQQLKRIIKEEVQAVLKETRGGLGGRADDAFADMDRAQARSRRRRPPARKPAPAPRRGAPKAPQKAGAKCPSPCAKAPSEQCAAEYVKAFAALESLRGREGLDRRAALMDCYGIGGAKRLRSNKTGKRFWAIGFLSNQKWYTVPA